MCERGFKGTTYLMSWGFISSSPAAQSRKTCKCPPSKEKAGASWAQKRRCKHKGGNVAALLRRSRAPPWFVALSGFSGGTAALVRSFACGGKTLVLSPKKWSATRVCQTQQSGASCIFKIGIVSSTGDRV
ncbi:unnamed protein product [Ixodes pacificus]